MKKTSLTERFFWNMVNENNSDSCLNSIIYGCLAILAKIYSCITAEIFKYRMNNVYDPCIPVISVGNITLGGTGKTPLIISLASFFSLRGKKVGVVSRGYGRKSKERILLSSEEKNPGIAGDEPLLIKERVPDALICVSSSRIMGIKMLKDAGADIILMDDGFQHPEIIKTMDIVVLDPLKPFGNKRVLPRGNLREYPSALKRASHFVFCKGEPDKSVLDELWSVFSRKASVFYYDIQSLYSYDESAEKTLAELKNKRILALSGIGQPVSFYNTLKNNGLNFKSLSFSDHHSYNREDYREINNEISERNIQAVITTEKDFQRLDASAIKSRIFVLKMELRLTDEFMDSLVQVIENKFVV